MIEYESITSANIGKYFAIGNPWDFDSVLDSYGDFNYGCFGYGIRENGRYWAYILVRADDENKAHIEALHYRTDLRPDDARLLLKVVGFRCDMSGIPEIDYSFLEAESRTFVADMLESCGYTKISDDAFVYRLNGNGLKEDKKLSPRFASMIHPMNEIDESMLVPFYERFGEDIPEYLDFRVTADAEPALSIGIVVKDVLKGYVICTCTSDSIEVRQAFVEETDKMLFGILMSKLIEEYTLHYSDRKEIYICAATEESDKLVNHYFKDRVISKKKLSHYKTSITE